MAATKTDPGSIAGLLQQLVIAVASQLPILNLIFAKPVAVENRPYEISDAVQGIKALAEDSTVGFAALEALMVASFNTLATDVGQTALKAVKPTWWDTAPAWWVAPPTAPFGPSADDNAHAVWGFLAGGQALEMGALLEEAGNLAVNTARAGGIPSQFSPWLRLLSPVDSQHDDAPSHGPLLRADHILLADTVLSWAQREAPTYGWFLDSSSRAVMGNYPPPNGGWFLLIDLDPGQFQAIKAALGLIPPAVSAPVWPGIAGVTLGTPVALSPTCVVAGPMHGVIIEITSAAPRQVYQVFGGMQGYRFVGGLQFVDDNGEAERIQSIGMQHEVIVCKSMAEAASCSIRTDSAVTGTVTPFVIT